MQTKPSQPIKGGNREPANLRTVDFVFVRKEAAKTPLDKPKEAPYRIFDWQWIGVVAPLPTHVNLYFHVQFVIINSICNHQFKLKLLTIVSQTIV